MKGTSFDAKSMCQVERARVVDLMSENKTFQKQISHLETDVNVLKTAISQHKHEKGCMLEDLEYQEYEEDEIEQNEWKIKNTL